jgi:hypothetical protein
LLSAQHWAHNFSISATDIDYITNLLLEKETPLSSKELAIALINSQIEEKRAAVNTQYEGTKVYRPADTYAVGDRLMFSSMDYSTATISTIRDGLNKDVGNFRVASVEFDNTKFNLSNRQREFAIEYVSEHPLNNDDIDAQPINSDNEHTAEDIINDRQITIVKQVDKALTRNPDLVRIAGTWFVRDLMIEIDVGHLHLAEAVLDMNEGGPLTTEQILTEMGGLGDAPQSLQTFSLNYHMNEDNRFDEVGPSGEVFWYLNRLLPRMVQQVPAILQYNPIEYDRGLLIEEMLQLEYELDDEHSPVKSPSPDEEVSLTLIYPHRRIGTLPINSETQYIFPEAKTPRIAITIIDVIDREEYPCWIVHEHQYVYGLAALYQKHHLPVGAYVYLNNTDDPSRIEIEFDSYRPRTEWIPLVNGTDGDQLHFDTAKRAIGADYDDMVIVGVNNLQEVDKLGNDIHNRQVPLAKLLRNLITELSTHNPQKTVHAKVLYSTLNILRRCPPGPIFATLIANPDFENVGGHYWKLSD